MVAMAVPAPRPPEPPLDQEPSAGRRAPERRLVRGAQRGSAEDFEALFALHWPRAYRPPGSWSTTRPRPRTSPRRRSSRRCGALDSFDRRRPFGPWLTRIVINRAIDWARARRLQAVPSDVGGPGRAAGRRAGRRRS